MQAGQAAQAVAAAFARRHQPGQALASEADAIARACHDMAVRFQRGGRLIVFGNGGSAADAQHVAVEFIHPVIVGKRALPAICLAADVAAVTGIANQDGFDEVFASQLELVAAGQDIALGISADGSCGNVLRALRRARDLGLLTIALAGGNGGEIVRGKAADHVLMARASDPSLVSEVQVTTYHILWELVHVFFDQPGLLEDGTGGAGGGRTGPAGHTAGADGIEGLYPFLYARSTDAGAVLDDVRRSTQRKAAEIAALRQSLAVTHGERLAECAGRMAASFRAGGRLFTFGNGGSSTDAQGVAQLFCTAAPPASRVPASSLTSDFATLTALSNDIGFEVVFARELAALARSGDVALGLSTSGGSANVLRAFDQASSLGLLTIGFAGYDGGKMAEADTIDYLFNVPSASVHRIQEAQTTLYHVLWELCQQALGGPP